MNTKERYVAFIDILGFKKIVENFCGEIHTLGNLLKGNFQAALFSAMTGQPVTVEISENGRDSKLDESSTRVKHYIFSDSIIIYTEESSVEELEEIIRVLNFFVAKSLLEGFPIRGALVKGEVYTNESIIIGTPIVKAVKLEGKQEWSGIIIDETCFDSKASQSMKEDLLDKKLICFEEVLLKKERIDKNNSIEYERKKHLVINWPEFMGMKISQVENLQKYFTRYADQGDHSAQQKQIETIAFCKKNLGSSPLPPAQYEATVIDDMPIFNWKDDDIQIELSKGSEDSQ